MSGIQGHIVENTDYVVEQHIMAHRELRSLLVHQVSLHRLGNSPGDVVISLDVLNDMTTNDLTLVTDRYDASTAWVTPIQQTRYIKSLTQC